MLEKCEFCGKEERALVPKNGKRLCLRCSVKEAMKEENEKKTSFINAIDQRFSETNEIDKAEWDEIKKKFFDEKDFEFGSVKLVPDKTKKQKKESQK